MLVYSKNKQNYICGKEKLKHKEQKNENLANSLDIAYGRKFLFVYYIFIKELLLE